MGGVGRKGGGRNSKRVGKRISRGKLRDNAFLFRNYKGLKVGYKEKGVGTGWDSNYGVLDPLSPLPLHKSSFRWARKQLTNRPPYSMVYTL